MLCSVNGVISQNLPLTHTHLGRKAEFQSQLDKYMRFNSHSSKTLSEVA